MYPECRHVRPSGENCNAAALKGSHWCYFHGRLHERYRAQQARQRLHNQRDASGRFTPAHDAVPHCSVDARPGQPSRPHPAPADPGVAADPSPAALTQTLDYGAIPVVDRESAAAGLSDTRAQDVPLQLPPVEDTASIQLALMDVLQALAANQLDPKRAGLLLYGLQVASSNAKHVMLRSSSIRSITYTGDGIPLAPQEYGYDLEDIEAESEAENEADAE